MQKPGTQRPAASPEAIALYLSAHADVHKTSTLERRLVTVALAHTARGFEKPTDSAKVRAVLAGIRRTKGSAKQRKTALRVSQLRDIVRRLPKGLLGHRDRALLLFGFAGAFRRSELVGLDVEDIETSAQGMTVTLKTSKVDPASRSRQVAIPYGQNPETCPVRAVKGWMKKASVNSGPLFRSVRHHGQVSEQRLSPQSVGLVVKRCVNSIGLDPKDFGGHSLRSGLATSAAEAGASERSIMEQTGHRSVATLRRYIQQGSLYCDNAASKVGL